MARLWIMVLVAVFMALPAAWADPRPGIDPQFRAEGMHLVETVSRVGDFRLVQADTEAFALSLGNQGGHPAGVLRLMRVTRQNVPRFHSRHYSMDISNFSSDPLVTDQLIRAAGLVAARDGGGADNPQVQQATPYLDPVRNVTSWMLVLAAVMCVVRRGRVTWELRLPHLIPAFIQLSLFTYWSLYWPGVRGQIPAIALQVVLGFAVDAVLSFARFGSWRVGASPLPVVLSTNLFVWFGAEGILISILVAFASKTLLHRNGRHMLNPSATGLSVAGLISYAFPNVFSVGGLFHTMNIPPNMAELILLLALLPQTRFRILPVSIAAALALRWTGNPAVLRPPIILAIALLATDPSTIPQTDLGKVQFGLFLGFGIVVTSWWLRHHGYTDDFAKVLPIPVANFLAPTFDRAGNAVLSALRWTGRSLGQLASAATADRVRAAAGRYVRPIPNLALVAFWLLLSIKPLGDEKPGSFEAALHWNLGTPLVVRDADDVPRCAHNPVFCRPFSFAQEVAAWRTRAHAHGPAVRVALRDSHPGH